MEKFAALLYGRDDGHLDHLAPLASLKKIPLYMTSKTLFEKAKAQYQDVQLILKAPNEVAGEILSQYDSLITTLPKELIDPIFMLDEITQNKVIKTYWLPHGNSDKQNMEALVNEQNLLVYGQNMINRLPEDIKSKTKVIGNFRKTYFELHKDIYNTLLSKRFNLDFEGPTYLYAPSWEASDIDQWIKSLIELKDSQANLMIKLHPNTLQRALGQTLKTIYDNTPGVAFITDFFPIYPLLSKTAALFTDISSIGYDFLTFDRPLLFTCKNNDPLHQCGSEVEIDNPYIDIDEDLYSSERKALLQETFGKATSKL